MEITRKMGMKRLLAANLAELARIRSPSASRCRFDQFNQSLQILREIGMQKNLGQHPASIAACSTGTRRPG